MPTTLPAADQTDQVMLFGVATAIFLAYFLRWRRRTLAARGNPSADSTVRTAVSNHLVDLVTILVPFIVLGMLGILKGDPGHILLDNELALAAAVLCCHKIVELGASRYQDAHGTVSTQFIESCRADNKRWQTYLIINLLLTIVAISANVLIEASQHTLWSAGLRFAVFYVGVALFLRLGVSHEVTERLLRSLNAHHESHGSLPQSD